jgi:hypothetical protein
MWHERAGSILQQVAGGASFSRANVISQSIYDTCSWGEVLSRMARARGSVLTSAVHLAFSGTRFRLDEGQQSSLAALASSIIDAANRVLRSAALAQSADEASRLRLATRSRAEAVLFTPIPPISYRQLEGRLLQASKFLSKNARDMPSIVEKCGIRPTMDEIESTQSEAQKIVAGAGVISLMIVKRLLGTVRRPSAASDHFAVGERYAPWLDPLVDRLSTNDQYKLVPQRSAVEI